MTGFYRRLGHYFQCKLNLKGHTSVDQERKSVPAAETKMKKQPSSLSSFLEYYSSLKEPRYAVLVTGEWGTGKTYQVRQAIPNDQSYYISLFGMDRSEDVIASVYAEMFPRKAQIKKLASSVGETAAEIPGFGSLAVNGLASGLIGAFLRQEVKSDKPLIFDDLERCSLGPKEILGIMNLYVEHHGCRVIVIAHDEKLAGEFVGTKEKVFGQTISVKPQIEEAFLDFHSSLDSAPAKEIIMHQRQNIIGVFVESELGSLRILRHVLYDLARLLNALADTHRSHSEAITEIVCLFAALDMEWRGGRLKASDLARRKETEMIHMMAPTTSGAAKPPPAILVANKRYSLADLTSTVLQDQALHDLFINGNFDAKSIRASIDASSYFLHPGAARPWQIVGGFDDIDDTFVDQALAKMHLQFQNREVHDPGEMLHIFALQMMMANKGISGKSVDDVEADSISYIDDLIAAGRMPPRGFDHDWYDEFEGSSYGFGYWVLSDYQDHFKRVFDHLLNAQQLALKGTFPSLIPEILKYVQTDGRKFRQLFSFTNLGNNHYASIPVLASIDPNEFVQAWLRSPKDNWRAIKYALRERYKGTILTRDLSDEAPWIAEVIRLLKVEADKVSGFQKLRIERIIPE
jgi:hypothetical protein